MADIDNYLSESRRPRGRKIFRILLVGFILLLCVGVFWLVMRSPILKAKTIEVLGNDKISKEEIVELARAKVFHDSKLAFLTGPNHMFLWPDRLTPEDMKSVPTLKSVEIKKQYGSRTIQLTVVERKAFGIWCFEKDSPARCFWFDDEGILFEKAPAVEGSIIKVVRDSSAKSPGIGGRVLPERLLPSLISIFKVLSASSLNVKEVRLEDISLEEIIVTTYNGPKLLFSLRFPADNALAVIESLGSGLKKLEYVDFRVENRAYYQ